MLPLVLAPDLDRSLIRLTEAEIEEPFSLVGDYCDEYTPGQVRNNFSELVRTALMSDDHFNLMGARSDLMIWAEHTEKLLETAYAIQALLEKNPVLKKQLCQCVHP